MRPNYLTILLLLVMSVFLLGNTGCSEQDLEKTGSVLEKGQGAANVLGNTVPATQPWATILASSLGLAGTVVAMMKGKKHKSRADNYSEAIESARREGEDESKIEVAHLEKVLDKDTKAHFNSSGTTKL